MEHLIEIYVSPNGDHLWEVVAAGAPSGDAHAESLSVARELLSELERLGENDTLGDGAGRAVSKAALKRR